MFETNNFPASLDGRFPRKFVVKVTSTLRSILLVYSGELIIVQRFLLYLDVVRSLKD